MKKYFNELNDKEKEKILEKNNKLFEELSDYIYEDKLYCQSEEIEDLFGKDWSSYIAYHDNYSSFYLVIKNWEMFINNLDRDYLTTEGIELYDYIMNKKNILDNMEWGTDNYYNLEEHLENKSQELLDICESRLHDYEKYHDFEECCYYLLGANYDNTLENCYIIIDDKGSTDYILYEDIAYTKSYE